MSCSMPGGLQYYTVLLNCVNICLWCTNFYISAFTAIFQGFGFILSSFILIAGKTNLDVSNRGAKFLMFSLLREKFCIEKILWLLTHLNNEAYSLLSPCLVKKFLTQFPWKSKGGFTFFSLLMSSCCFPMLHKLFPRMYNLKYYKLNKVEKWGNCVGRGYFQSGDGCNYAKDYSGQTHYSK